MTPQSPAVTAPLSGEPNETSPERGGEPSPDGGGVLREIICLMCKVYGVTPQSPAVPAPLSGELDETSPERGGEPSSDGGGVLVKSLA